MKGTESRKIRESKKESRKRKEKQRKLENWILPLSICQRFLLICSHLEKVTVNFKPWGWCTCRKGKKKKKKGEEGRGSEEQGTILQRDRDSQQWECSPLLMSLSLAELYDGCLTYSSYLSCTLLTPLANGMRRVQRKAHAPYDHIAAVQAWLWQSSPSEVPLEKKRFWELIRAFTLVGEWHFRKYKICK